MKRAALLLALASACITVAARAADESRMSLTFTGHWSGSAPDGTIVSYTFAKDGTVVWRVKEPNFEKTFPSGLKGTYEVRVGKPLCELDIYNFDEPRFKDIRFQGILEIVDAQSFRMEGKPSHQGERPKEFGKEAVLFKADKQ